MTFDEYDNMVITDEDGNIKAFSFVDNMDIIEDALEQVAPEPLENIRDYYGKELDEAQNEEAENDANHGYEQSIKELVERNWDAVYPIVAKAFNSKLFCF